MPTPLCQAVSSLRRRRYEPPNCYGSMLSLRTVLDETLTEPVKFFVKDWREQAEKGSSSSFKRALYVPLRPVLSFAARRHISHRMLRETQPEMVLGTRGFLPETRRCWATGGRPVKGGTILVQGCGTGWEIVGWAKREPGRIIATDLFSFAETWGPIEEHCRSRYGVEVDFRQAPLEDHSFLPSGSIDLCTSDTVLEHCRDLAAVMRETRRVVKPDGFVYAGYGPLWYTAGGDHFARGGLANAFNHIALGRSEYERYFAEHRRQNEDAQSGGRYVELDLFSRLTTRQYLKTFRDAGLSVEALVMQINPVSLRFARAYPKPFQDLVEHCRPDGVTRDDLLIKANYARLRPAASAAHVPNDIIGAKARTHR